MKKIYIVLIRAHTGLGALGRKVTRSSYTHIAVTFDRSMSDFVSFSRKYHYFPFEAGLMHEYRDYYAFGQHKDFVAKIFELPVDDVHYKAVREYISGCENDASMQFNLLSMIFMPLTGAFSIPHTENCMSFAARCAELSGCVGFDRPYWKYSIRDIDDMLTGYKIFEGRIPRGSRPEDDYMTPFEPVRYFSGMIKLFSVLIYRLIFRKP